MEGLGTGQEHNQNKFKLKIVLNNKKNVRRTRGKKEMVRLRKKSVTKDN